MGVLEPLKDGSKKQPNVSMAGRPTAGGDISVGDVSTTDQYDYQYGATSDDSLLKNRFGRNRHSPTSGDSASSTESVPEPESDSTINVWTKSPTKRTKFLRKLRRGRGKSKTDDEDWVGFEKTQKAFIPTTKMFWAFRLIGSTQSMVQHVIVVFFVFFQRSVFDTSFIVAIGMTVPAFMTSLAVSAWVINWIQAKRRVYYLEGEELENANANASLLGQKSGTNLRETTPPKYQPHCFFVFWSFQNRGIAAGLAQLLGCFTLVLVLILCRQSLTPYDMEGGITAFNTNITMQRAALGLYFIAVIFGGFGVAWWNCNWTALVSSLPDGGYIMANWCVANSFAGWPISLLSFILLAVNSSVSSSIVQEDELGSENGGLNPNRERRFWNTLIIFSVAIAFLVFMIVGSFYCYRNIVKKNPLILRKIVTESDDTLTEEEIHDLMRKQRGSSKLGMVTKPPRSSRTRHHRTEYRHHAAGSKTSSQKSEQAPIPEEGEHIISALGSPKSSSPTKTSTSPKTTSPKTSPKNSATAAAVAGATTSAESGQTRPSGHTLQSESLGTPDSVNRSPNGNGLAHESGDSLNTGRTHGNEDACNSMPESPTFSLRDTTEGSRISADQVKHVSDVAALKSTTTDTCCRPYWSLVWDRFDILSGIFLTYFISYLFFPTAFILLHSENSSKYHLIATIATYAFIEPIPRWLAGFAWCIPRKHYLWVVITRSVLFSLIFTLTFHFSPQGVHPVVPIVYIVLFSFTSGYCVTSGFLRGPEGIKNTREQVMVGTMSSNAELSGQMTGAIVGFIWAWSYERQQDHQGLMKV